MTHESAAADVVMSVRYEFQSGVRRTYGIRSWYLIVF